MPAELVALEPPLRTPVTSPVTPPPPAAARVVVSPATDNIRLAGEHFVAAMLYLVAGTVGLVWIAPDLAVGAYLSPHVAGVTHLFTLGWLTTTILGALYQLLPVALGAPVRSKLLGHVSFWTLAPGAGLFACGVASGITMLHHTGLALVATGVLLAVGNIGSTLPLARHRDVTWAAIAIALSFLTSTLVLGIILLHNLHTGFIADARIRVLSTHLHVALVGWALTMMVGVSNRLLPMFLLARDVDTRWNRRSIALLATGVLALAFGLVLRIAVVTVLGAALLDAGVACFVWQAHLFYRASVRKKVDVGMRFAACALAFLVVSAVLGSTLLWAGVAHIQLATAYITVGLLGGIVLFVIGFFYKIVPLLAWSARYRGRMGKEPVPTVAQMFSPRIAHGQLAFMALGVTLLAAGIGAGSPHVARCGAVLWAGGVLLFVNQITRVAMGGKS